MNIIIDQLKEIESKKNIRILYACETGSRAWGFPSTDSDFDVRFIYKHERDWYLSLGQRKDSLEFSLAGDLDITGWDLRKSLLLLKKSNAPVIERFQSPVVYFSDEVFKIEFMKLIRHYYSPIAVFYHHYSLAKKFWEDIKDSSEIKLKGYFYLIRSLLSCNWIIIDDTVLPMHIEGLMTKIDNDVREKLRTLIELKATVDEKYVYTKDREISQWILNTWERIESSRDNLKSNNADYSLSNDFFIKILYEEDNNRLGKI
jgi:predicted nucleotidyltransferase